LFSVYTRYILFGIIVLIVLLNVLIAIVVDTYGTIRDDQAEEVFWLSRLDFVAEVEVIKALMKKLLKKLFGICNCNLFKGTCECKWLTELRWFMHFIWFIRFILGAVTCGWLWPDNVRSLLWGGPSPKDHESMKNSIQHIKKIVAFEEKETKLEVKLNAMVAEIKNNIKSKNDQMMKEMNEHRSKNDQMMKDLNEHKSKNDHMMKEINDKMDKMMGFFQKLLDEKQTGSISGDNNTRSSEAPQTVFTPTNPAENIDQHDLTSDFQG
jgi:hypothetical protein